MRRIDDLHMRWLLACTLLLASACTELDGDRDTDSSGQGQNTGSSIGSGAPDAGARGEQHAEQAGSDGVEGASQAAAGNGGAEDAGSLGDDRMQGSGAAGEGSSGGAGTGGAGGTSEAAMDDGDAGGSDAGQADGEDAGGSDAGQADGGLPRTCCPDGNCLCRGDAPTSLTGASGPLAITSYHLLGAGCVFYPTDGVPPFAAVALAEGYRGLGGCRGTQLDEWGPFYASHGIVVVVVESLAPDQPVTRGAALLDGVAALKAEHDNGSSPLFGKLAGRYGVSGFDMGGGGASLAAGDDPSLLTSVGLMSVGSVGQGVSVPTLLVCATSDDTAPCDMFAQPTFAEMPDTTPKMWIELFAGHAGQPSESDGMLGAYALAFQKTFLERDERWRPLLLQAPAGGSNIQ